MINKKIIICSTIKNEGKNLNRFFKIIDNLILNFNDYFLIFVESDSFDNSKEIIKDYLFNKKGILLSKNLEKSLNRIKKLEISRNEYLNYIKKNENLYKFDYMFVLDADNVNNQLKFEDIKDSLNKEYWNAIFPNQKIFYYDIFALRIEKYLEENFIEKIKNEIKNNKSKNLKKIFHDNFTAFFNLSNNFNERFINVKSAFGGLGIYKLEKILEFSYESFNGTTCEHVKFNKDINDKYGKLYIDQKLINSYGINKHTINGILCSNSVFFAKRFLNKIK